MKTRKILIIKRLYEVQMGCQTPFSHEKPPPESPVLAGTVRERENLTHKGYFGLDNVSK
jgi:hypothetical protein